MKGLIISILVIGLLIGLASFVYGKTNKLNAMADANQMAKVPSDNTIFPLVIGSKGKAVKCIQSFLGSLKVDGIFGKQTLMETKSYYSTPNGEVTKKMFVSAVVKRQKSQIQSVFPMKLGDEESFAIVPLQIMLGVSTNVLNLFDEDTLAQVQAVFGTDQVSYEQYTALCQHVFNLTTQDLA